ncbi:hypothetical protein ACIGGF_12290 [Rhodococcus sp. NPDC078407]|uniref:hypothetical protein n=1 Tax=Rhodococcus sp. NPDC078407 TaxID=3364509 RepID=UPI0037C678D3
MYAAIDQHTSEPPSVKHLAEGFCDAVRISYGATTLTLTISEAVDLVDALATTLGSIPEPDPLLGA